MPLEACRNPSDARLEPALRNGGSDGSAPRDLGASWTEKPKGNGKRIARQRAEKSRPCPGVHTVGGQWFASPYIGVFPDQEEPEVDCHHLEH